MGISDKKVIKLVKITPENNNKFYIMTKLNSSEWEAQWGRIKGELGAVDASSIVNLDSSSFLE